MRKVYEKFTGILIPNTRHVTLRDYLMANPLAVMTTTVEGTLAIIEQSWAMPPDKSFVHWAKETTPSIGGQGIALQKGSPWKRCIDDKIIQSLSFGLWYKWKADTMFIGRKYADISREEKKKMIDYIAKLPEVNSAENHPLSLNELQTAYYAYLAMLILALISFVVEKLVIL